jgi:hypothetical protein
MPQFYFFFQCPNGNACLRSIYLHLKARQQIYEFEFLPSLMEVQRFLAGLTNELTLGENYTLKSNIGGKGRMTLFTNNSKILLYNPTVKKFLERYCLIKYYGVVDVEGMRDDVRVVSAGYP